MLGKALYWIKLKRDFLLFALALSRIGDGWRSADAVAVTRAKLDVASGGVGEIGTADTRTSTG